MIESFSLISVDINYTLNFSLLAWMEEVNGLYPSKQFTIKMVFTKLQVSAMLMLTKL